MWYPFRRFAINDVSKDKSISTKSVQYQTYFPCPHSIISQINPINFQPIDTIHIRFAILQYITTKITTALQIQLVTSRDTILSIDTLILNTHQHTKLVPRTLDKQTKYYNDR